MPAATPVQWNGYDCVVPFIDWQSAVHELSEPASQRAHAGILEEVDQTAERTFIEAKACGSVEATEAGPAEGADALIIERESVLKRGVAGRTEVFRFERRRGIQARGTDRNTGESGERLVADSTVRWEKKRKNSVGDRAEAEGGRSR